MELSVNTDYRADRGDPSPYLRDIAAHGFTHIHWCHQWNTDFLYSRWEVDQIADWLREYDLRLLDLHASAGSEKRWGSSKEYERQSGVELVLNRLEMTARLGGRAIVMHIDPGSCEDSIRRSLDEIEPHSKRLGVRVAIENGRFDEIEKVLAAYGPEYVGVCYDCGHGNIGDADGLTRLGRVKDRLIAMHLHDNDGVGDQHKPPFTATVDWERLSGIIATSSYQGPINMEVSMRTMGHDDQDAFLKQTYAAGVRITEMVQAAR